MGKTLEVSDMPALSDEMHTKLRALERDLRTELSHCCHSYDLRDPDAAFEYVRTYAIKFFDCFYGFYSHIPDPQYESHWRPASEKFAYGRIVKCIENHSAVEAFFKRSSDRIERIKRTISDHAERKARRFPTTAFGPPPLPEEEKQVDAREMLSTLSGRPASSVYTKAAIDLTPSSPLLAMVRDAQSAHMRPASASVVTIGEQIKSLRDECHLTVEEMAQALEVDRKSISRHLSSQYQPSKRHLVAYEKLFSQRLGKQVILKTSRQCS